MNTNQHSRNRRGASRKAVSPSGIWPAIRNNHGRRPKHLALGRRGAVAVLALFLMMVLLAFIALATDVGYISYVDTELQRTADAAAIAAACTLVEQDQVGATVNADTLASVAASASQYAALNKVANAPVIVSSSDTQIGQLPYPFSSSSTMTFTDPAQFNAVKVRIRKTSDAGSGGVPLFFARILGYSACDMQREATAAFINSVGGFRSPAEGQTLQILPFALDKQTWDNMIAGTGSDNYKWDPVAKRVTSGHDEVKEVNLYPQGTGSPGNRGTVNIGPSNNSTSHLSNQIRNGISKADMDCMGGSLQFDEHGKLYLNADTGISAGVKDDLASIIGQTRIIPIFTEVTGNGNNAEYTIVEFVGVRVMYVKLTGSPSGKAVLVQPANVVCRGAIPPSNTNGSSQYVYSPVWLVH